MNGKKRRQMVQELLIEGYTQERIAEKLNVSARTIARDVKKLRYGAQTWLADLANVGFVYEYKESLGGIKNDIMFLLEMLEEESVKVDNHLRLKISKQISHLRKDYATLLHKGPMVWAIDIIMKKKTDNPIPMPKMKAIYGDTLDH